MGSEKECNCPNIMGATHQALIKHGYADLTVEKIASEYCKGKSNIYYHYEDKEELMLAFLDYLTEIIEKDVFIESAGENEEKLEEFLKITLALEDEDLWELRKAIFEMRVKAPYSERFSEKFEELDSSLHEYLTGILRDMGEDEADEKARLILSVVEGSVDRSIAMKDRNELKDTYDRLLNFMDI